MNWEGLCLSPKAHSQPEIVVLTNPFPSEAPKVVVAAVYRDSDRAATLSSQLVNGLTPAIIAAI